MSDQGGSVERWTIWACDHGGVQREPGHIAPNYQCAECGAKPIEVVPATALTREQEATNKLDELVARFCKAVGEPVPEDAIVRAEQAERDLAAAREQRDEAQVREAQAEQECDVLREALREAEEERWRVRARLTQVEDALPTDREISACRWGSSIIAGVESQLDDSIQSGVREGEATSDVLSGLASRAERIRSALGDTGGDDG